jgi:hypothetical protein
MDTAAKMAGLGWLGDSGQVPRKARAIAVDASSLLDLQAALYEKQAQAAGKEEPSRTETAPRRSRSAVFEQPNPGVRERDERVARASAQETDEARHSLQRKSELYERLQHGGTLAGDANERQPRPESEVAGDEEGFLVDFHRKQAAQLLATDAQAAPELLARRLAMERERAEWVRSVTLGDSGSAAPERSNSSAQSSLPKGPAPLLPQAVSEKDLVLQVARETAPARERHRALQQRRRQLRETRKRRLRDADQDRQRLREKLVALLEQSARDAPRVDGEWDMDEEQHDAEAPRPQAPPPPPPQPAVRR